MCIFCCLNGLDEIDVDLDTSLNLDLCIYLQLLPGLKPSYDHIYLPVVSVVHYSPIASPCIDMVEVREVVRRENADVLSHIRNIQLN